MIPLGVLRLGSCDAHVLHAANSVDLLVNQEISRRRIPLSSSLLAVSAGNLRSTDSGGPYDLTKLNTSAAHVKGARLAACFCRGSAGSLGKLPCTRLSLLTCAVLCVAGLAARKDFTDKGASGACMVLSC